jgi:hypothetical protein
VQRLQPFWVFALIVIAPAAMWEAGSCNCAHAVLLRHVCCTAEHVASVSRISFRGACLL